MCLDYEHSDRNTYGFVNFARSTNHPELFVDTTLQKREIEYRVCAHRRHDKKLMGVVKHIYAKYSLIKNVPTVIENSVKASNEALLRIVELFPEMVTRMDLKHGGDGSVVTMKFKRIT
jgi:hypothetical protein